MTFDELKAGITDVIASRHDSLDKVKEIVTLPLLNYLNKSMDWLYSIDISQNINGVLRQTLLSSVLSTSVHRTGSIDYIPKLHNRKCVRVGTGHREFDIKDTGFETTCYPLTYIDESGVAFVVYSYRYYFDGYTVEVKTSDVPKNLKMSLSDITQYIPPRYAHSFV